MRDGRVDGKAARRSHILDHGLQNGHRSAGAETPDKVAGCLGVGRPAHVEICQEGTAELQAVSRLYCAHLKLGRV